MRIQLPLLLLAAGLVGGCTQPEIRPSPTPVVQEAASKADDWQKVASKPDADRIARLRQAWDEALSDARAAGSRQEVEAEGALLQGDAALARPSPTPGSYECRMVRLGRLTPRARAFEKFKPFFCYVEVQGEYLTIVKQTGSQRPAGYLYPDPGRNRLVFLGSLAPAGNDASLAYGEDAARDLAGVLERVAPFRYRLVIPWPQSDSKLDVIELVPVVE